jgi:TPR repeat protein
MGDSMAQCQLGFLWENGFFGKPDGGEAVRWYRKSADQQFPHGQYRLGVCYHLGKGIEQDFEAAARLFKQAVRRGHKDAAERLKVLQDMGIGEDPAPTVPSTPPPPMPPLPPELDDPDVTDAAAAYLKQAMENNAKAQLKLGLAYHVGRSAPRNPKLACFWVMRAMLAGDYIAAQYLQYCTRMVPPGEHGALQTKIFRWTPGQEVPQL